MRAADANTTASVREDLELFIEISRYLSETTPKVCKRRARKPRGSPLRARSRLLLRHEKLRTAAVRPRVTVCASARTARLVLMARPTTTIPIAREH
jgi:hypothetical protein